MAYTTINKQRQMVLRARYTGNNSSARTITGVGFQPDMNWSKIRSEANDHWISDAVRGANKIIRPNTTDVELVNGSSGYLSSFNSDGYVIAAGSGTNDNFNKNSGTMASWNWKAGGGQGSSNTDGSINTIYTSVNTTAGFSISSYTGTGSAGTIGHGLGAEPHLIIIKKLNSNEQWFSYHKPLGNTGALVLNTTAAKITDSGYWNSTTPTSSVFSVTSNGSNNASGDTYVAYCFAPKAGYSKFGSYIGNGNADGTFIYTGFKPAFFLLKRYDGVEGWYLMDNKRDPFNLTSRQLFPASNSAQNNMSSSSQVNGDMLSNGFKIRATDTAINANGGNYIYMAFGQSLVGSNNIPCTAR